MKDRVFLDSNILIYSYSITEPDKQGIARELISQNNSFISTQVLQELTNTVTRKFKFNYKDAKAAIHECCQNNNLHINTGQTILRACELADHHHWSFYDSLIVSAALECECLVLYSEDLQNGQMVDGKLKIANPFL